jgi:hypothetical protein
MGAFAETPACCGQTEAEFLAGVRCTLIRCAREAGIPPHRRGEAADWFMRSCGAEVPPPKRPKPKY